VFSFDSSGISWKFELRAELWLKFDGGAGVSFCYNSGAGVFPTDSSAIVLTFD
jgi:hypothetical protein